MTRAGLRPAWAMTRSALANLAADAHATAWRLGERELRQLEAFLGMQRWVR